MKQLIKVEVDIDWSNPHYTSYVDASVGVEIVDKPSDELGMYQISLKEWNESNEREQERLLYDVVNDTMKGMMHIEIKDYEIE
jgi:Cys-tRNA synthase (O-phospho-L-seryl-tRNA:Cys-tRNA synthase)